MNDPKENAEEKIVVGDSGIPVHIRPLGSEATPGPDEFPLERDGTEEVLAETEEDRQKARPSYNPIPILTFMQLKAFKLTQD